MKRNEKGFTLIELLAVIIILAIIALIAIPTITGIIDNSRETAAADTTYGVISAIELWYSTEMLNMNGDSPFAANANPSVSCSSGTCQVAQDDVASGVSTRVIAVKGDVPSVGTFTVSANDGSVTAMSGVTVNGKSCSLSNNKVTCSNPSSGS